MEVLNKKEIENGCYPEGNRGNSNSLLACCVVSLYLGWVRTCGPVGSSGGRLHVHLCHGSVGTLEVFMTYRSAVLAYCCLPDGGICKAVPIAVRIIVQVLLSPIQ